MHPAHRRNETTAKRTPTSLATAAAVWRAVLTHDFQRFQRKTRPPPSTLPQGSFSPYILIRNR